MIENNLKYAREELELTQTELGSILHVSKYTIHGWENSHDSIPLSKLIKFCNKYHYSLDYILKLTRHNNYKYLLSSDKNITAANLKKLRNKLKLSQKEIANICSISQTSYSSYETGKYLISTIALYTLCTHFNLSADTLCSDKFQ